MTEIEEALRSGPRRGVGGGQTASRKEEYSMYQGQGSGFLRIVGLITVIRAIRRRLRRGQMQRHEDADQPRRQAVRDGQENDERE